jgi:hypothetical protein
MCLAKEDMSLTRYCEAMLYTETKADWIMHVQVVTSQGEEVFFKIKRNTKLHKLQGAYANKVGKDVGSIR